MVPWSPSPGTRYRRRDSAYRMGGPAPSLEALVEEIARKAKTLWKPSPRRVINATGVVIHTNLGAPRSLSEEAAKAAMEAGAGYSDLEIDLEKGERGGRDATLKSLVSRLTGAESALAVNNNAAALHLILSVLALGRDVIVSRGEAVEIGGGVRVPEILSASGARLVEVGTTNRTYLSDYRNAITENTALFLKVHSSNFKVIGFTEVPDTGALAALGREAGIPVVHDVGSGCLVDTRDFGLSDEPRPPGQHRCRNGPGGLFGRQAAWRAAGRHYRRSPGSRLRADSSPLGPGRQDRQDDDGSPHRHLPPLP